MVEFSSWFWDLLSKLGTIQNTPIIKNKKIKKKGKKIKERVNHQNHL